MTTKPVKRIICWRRKWSSPLESSWSLLRKVAFLNAASPADMRQVFGSGQHKTAAHWKFCRRSDLRLLTGINTQLLVDTLDVSTQALRESTVVPFVREGELDIVTSPRLRFCPSCLRCNFHSSIYQILLIDICPIHADRLTSRCESCDLANVPYTIDTAAFRTLRGCVKCLAHLEHTREVRPDNRRESSTLQEIADKLRSRTQAELIHSR